MPPVPPEMTTNEMSSVSILLEASIAFVKFMGMFGCGWEGWVGKSNTDDPGLSGCIDKVSKCTFVRGDPLVDMIAV